MLVNKFLAGELSRTRAGGGCINAGDGDGERNITAH